MKLFFKILGLTVGGIFLLVSSALAIFISKAAFELEPPIKNYNYYN